MVNLKIQVGSEIDQFKSISEMIPKKLEIFKHKPVSPGQKSSFFVKFFSRIYHKRSALKTSKLLE